MPTILGAPGRTQIPEELAQAPKLDTLVVWDYDRVLYQIPEYIRTIAANPSLKCIRIEPHISPQEPHYMHSNRKTFCDQVKQDVKLKSLLDFGDER